MRPAAALAMRAHLEKLEAEGRLPDGFEPARIGSPRRWPSRRDQIKLTPEEQLELLDEERIVVCTTNGPRGWPHSMPLWYTVRDGDIWVWTFAKSQKVKNLERDPRCTLLSRRASSTASCAASRSRPRRS